MIYVGNLPNSANETNIKELFDTFSGGEVRIQHPPLSNASSDLMRTNAFMLICMAPVCC